jgi:UDP-glucose 4-epimerase
VHSLGPKRVLVTGGAGFIGANLVRLLLRHGYEVAVFDNLSVGSSEYLADLSIQFIKGDILDRPTVSEAVVGCTGVVHLAAQTGVPESLLDPRKDCEVNVLGTLNLLEACRAEKARGANGSFSCSPRFIFASSNAPLGKQAPPATEDKAPLPIAPYGASKLAAEGYCLAYNGSWGLETIALRFGNVYGPFSAHKNSVVAKFFKDILVNGQVVVNGNGSQTRDFIYVEDLCRAILLALESNVKGEVFQIATGVETTICTLAAFIREVAGRDIQIDYGPERQGDIQRNYSSVSKAQRILRWQPTTNLPVGLRQTREWFWKYMAELAPLPMQQFKPNLRPINGTDSIYDAQHSGNTSN